MRSATSFLELLMLSMIAACDQSAPEQPATGAGGAPAASNTTAPGATPTASSHGGQPAAPQTTQQPPPSTTGSSSGGAPGASSFGGAPASTGTSSSGARATMSGGSPSGGAGAVAGNGAGGAGATAGMPSGGGSSAPPAAASRVDVAMYGDSEITAIDADTYAIVDHIPVGRGPAILLETADHSKLYTANWADNTVSSVTLSTRKVVAISESGQPIVVAISPDGKFVYAGLTSNKIDVISTDTDTIVRSLPMSQLPLSVITSSDGKQLYIAFTGGTAEAIDAQTGAVVHQPIAVGALPAWLSITPEGSRAYTLNWTAGSVSVINTATWQTAATVSTGAGSVPIIGAVAPDGSLLGVTDFGAVNTVLIDTKTNAVVHTLKFNGRPIGVGFSSDSQRVYVSDYGAPSLKSDPNALILTGTSGRLPMNPGPGTVTVFSASTGEMIHQITVGQWPSSIVVQPG